MEKIKQLKTDIKEMKKGSFEEIALITYYSLKNYFKSLSAFGWNNKTTKDNLKIISEMFIILKRERFLLNYILRNRSQIDPEIALNLIADLDKLNDQTVLYYYKIMDDIEVACETKKDYYGNRSPKDFLTLIEENTFFIKVAALTSKIPELKILLNYEEEFWTFITPLIRTCQLPSSLNDKVPYVREIYDNENQIVSLTILLPEIVDYESALINLNLLQKAYNIYKSLNQTTIVSHSDLPLEKLYQKNCLKKILSLQ